MTPHLLIFGLTLPEPASSAAGSRMMQIIEVFKEAGWKITFATSAGATAHSESLKEYGIELVKVDPNNSETSKILIETAPDAVLFDRFMTEEQYGWRVAEICPNALRILDTEDLHFLRKARQEAVEEGRNLTKADLQNLTAKREIAAIYRSDISLIISEAEMDLLTQEFKTPVDILYYLPFLYPKLPEDYLKDFPDFEERKDFVFIGNYLHAPNLDAVYYLKNEIWPGIRKLLPEAELHIYGAYSERKIAHLHQPKEGFLIKNRADDLKEVLGNARVLLAPVRFGAGLKGKIFDAIHNGTPCVTTSTGAEGINGKMTFNGFITDNPEELISTSVKLYTQPSIWKKSRENGIQIINRRFDKTTFADDFLQGLMGLRNDLENHRQSNFTGQMLMHHRLQSTKFLSRWIETKNTKLK